MISSQIKLLVIVILSVVLNYAFLLYAQSLRISQPTFVQPLIKLAEKYNPRYQTPQKPYELEEIFNKWDTNYYLSIARTGYDQIHFSTQEKYNWAFYPLYPFTIKIASQITGVTSTTQLILFGKIFSTLCIFLSLVFLKRIFNHFGYKSADWNYFLILLFTFPLAYIYGFVYTESLFLFLSTMVFYFLIKKSYITATWFTAFAAVTRLTGIFLLPIIWIHFLWSYRKEKSITEILYWLISMGTIAVTPLIIYFNHLGSLTGEVMAAFKIQAAWNNDGTFPFITFIGYFKDYGLTFNADHGLSIILLFFSWILILYSGINIWRKRKSIEKTEVLLWLFSVILIFINSSVNSRSSIFRYTTTIPYLYLILGQVVSSKKWLFWIIIGTFLVLHFLFLTFFLWQIPLYGF